MKVKRLISITGMIGAALMFSVSTTGEAGIGLLPWEKEQGQRLQPEYNIPLYTGEIYPAPREAEYLDEFVPLGRVGLIPGTGVAGDAGHVSVLRERLERYGSVCGIADNLQGEFDVFICVGEGELLNSLHTGNPPDKPEGFLIENTVKNGKPVVALKGNDKLGLLWAVTSFNQLIKHRDGKPVARLANVSDYPDVSGKRAYTGHDIWFPVNMLRPNIVVSRKARQMFGRARGTWREDSQTHGAAWRAEIDRMAAFFNPLGIEWYDCILPNHSSNTGERQIRSKSDDDFQILLELAMYCASRGGNFGMLYDDFRFPLHPDDIRDFGSAREADVYLLTKLFNAVRAEYPEFKLLFCPPFYWGPLSDSSDVYGESRDKYLKAIGQLPEGIEIYWTGSRVRTERTDPEHLAWITELIRRKPVYWQNACGIIRAGINIPFDTDPVIAWKNWYNAEFFDGLSFYTFNFGGNILNMTLFDALWNHSAYDPERSVEIACRKIIGAAAYPKFAEYHRKLAWFDPYGRAPNAAAARDVEALKRKTGELVEFAAELDSVLPEGSKNWLNYDGGVGRQRYLESLLALPNLEELGAQDDKVRDLAVEETGADPERDIILTPGSFRVKRPAQVYHWRTAGPRFVIWINSRESDGHDTMTASFPMHGQAATEDYELIICALNHNREPPCKIRITLNGNTIFEGENPFDTYHFKTHSFKVPAGFFAVQENVFVISNLETEGGAWGPPWFMLNYAVLRPVK